MMIMGFLVCCFVISPAFEKGSRKEHPNNSVALDWTPGIGGLFAGTDSDTGPCVKDVLAVGMAHVASAMNFGA